MSQTAVPLSLRRFAAGLACAVLLLGAFWLIAVGCATPNRGPRLFDQGQVEKALPLLEAGAARGSVEAAYRLGLALESGQAVPVDTDRALSLFTAAAAKNHLPSMLAAGDLLLARSDASGAAAWYRRAANRGDVTAMTKLGVMLATGQGPSGDIDAGLALLARAAKAGNVRAATVLGQTLLALGARGDPRGHDPGQAAAYIAAAASTGDPEAQNRLADLYATGQGVPRDAAKAANLRRQAADAGFAQAAYDLGLMYLSGQGVTPYPLEAARLFTRAAKAGHVPAMLRLADMLYEGQGVFRDPAQALTLYDAAGKDNDSAAIRLCHLFAAGPVERRDPGRALRFCGKAVAAGDDDAALLLGLGMVKGHIPGDAASAAILLSRAAWGGNPTAMYAMALLHLDGLGVAGNPAEAYRWCHKAAEAGLPEAKALLAALSEEELPSAGNLAKAVTYYREAAAAGDSEAAFALGSLLSKGISGQADFAQARAWYQKAAQAGQAQAQFNLGLMYLTGKGGAPDDKQALHWLLEAARQGDAGARASAAALLQAGRGAPADPREAFRLYRLAAGQGLARAQANLSGLYYEGRVVPRNVEEALFWLSLASRGEAHDPEAVRAVKAKTALEKKLAPEQLDRVRERLAAFKPAAYDPAAEKAILAGITFLPPSARGPGLVRPLPPTQSVAPAEPQRTDDQQPGLF